MLKSYLCLEEIMTVLFSFPLDPALTLADLEFLDQMTLKQLCVDCHWDEPMRSVNSTIMKRKGAEGMIENETENTFIYVALYFFQ